MSEPSRPQAREMALQGRGHQFQYTELESQDTFRLLRLHAGRGDRIECSIHHYVLGTATCPSYRALSYTWGDQSSRHEIHFPDGSSLRVRKNLKNALRSVRDEASDCWLWCDAICINQNVDIERNHQVRLMAEIYSTANVVLVWLQSGDENADVTRAFRFVTAAARYHSSNHSLYYYSKAHSEESPGNWRSLQKLCGLRYWTRKWIIQELIHARTVVLRADKSECSMEDLETCCQQLYQNRDDEAYKKLDTGKHNARKAVIASPAARLALQRAEASREPQPRLLHRLVERYADNQCNMRCDHVYALYSLVGPHRRHLRIDYSATPVQRLVAVLDFVHTYERLPRSEVLQFAQLLVRLLGVRHDDILQERRLADGLNLILPATVLGSVELRPETKPSMEIRKSVKPLLPMPVFSLDTSQDIWVLTANEGVASAVGRPDMTFFSITNSELRGLAACRLEAGDAIWLLPRAPLVFIVRQTSGRQALLLGRAYLFTDTRDGLEPWNKRPFRFNGMHLDERHISVSLAKLLELGSLASYPVKGSARVTDGSKHVGGMIGRFLAFFEDNSVALRKSWHSRVVTAASVLIFIFVLAVILLQVVNK